jgi:predicted Zn-ribbon and HTH transcriptional regulator
MKELRKRKETFHDVLHNFDDQVSVRRLIEEEMPDEIKEAVVNRYNAIVDAVNRRNRFVIPGPIVCVGCGRALENERCPWLVANNLQVHN